MVFAFPPRNCWEIRQQRKVVLRRQRRKFNFCRWNVCRGAPAKTLQVAVSGLLEGWKKCWEIWQEQNLTGETSFGKLVPTSQTATATNATKAEKQRIEEERRAKHIIWNDRFYQILFTCNYEMSQSQNLRWMTGRRYWKKILPKSSKRKCLTTFLEEEAGKRNGQEFLPHYTPAELYCPTQ